jgi:hypothetical protein
MPQRAPVDDYLDVLTRELSFDRSLAHRVRQEVEDHLWEATRANGDTSIEAQARAVASFGEARVMASQYAALSLLRQARRSGAIIVLASGALYIAIKGRVAWYDLMQWGLSDAPNPCARRYSQSIAQPIFWLFCLASSGGPISAAVASYRGSTQPADHK